MATEHMVSSVFESNSAAVQPDLLVCATLHLMSQYSSQGGCVRLASVIERHLKALAELPDLAPVLAATCRMLSEQWAQVVESSLPRPERSGFFSKLIAGRRELAPR